MKTRHSLIVLAWFCPALGFAQEAEPGGVFFTFNLNQSFEAGTDRDLITPEADEGFDSVTTLGFGVVSETREQRLAFDVDTGLRLSDDTFSGDDTNLRLAYERNSADAVLNVSATLNRDDIAFLRDIDDFINADGELVLPDDFDDLTGTGIRQEATLAASLRWGETAPIGYRVGLSQRLLRYQDAGAGLIDSDTSSVNAGLRLDFNAVTTGNIDLRYTVTDEDDDGAEAEDFTTLESALIFDRPLGDLTARLSATREDDGDVFWAGAIDRRYELPGRTLNGSLGFAQDEDGDPRLTGRLDYILPRPAGQLDVAAIHALTAGSDRSTTTFRAGFLQELSPVSTMRFGVDFAQASNADGSEPLATGSVSAQYGVTVAEFWELSAGGRVDLRDDDGTFSRSETIFLTIDRQIAWKR